MAPLPCSSPSAKLTSCRKLGLHVQLHMQHAPRGLIQQQQQQQSLDMAPSCCCVCTHPTCVWSCCSVVFSFLGRDFYNALSERDVEGFKLMIVKYLAGFVLGIPVFVYTDYLQVSC